MSEARDIDQYRLTTNEPIRHFPGIIETHRCNTV